MERLIGLIVAVYVIASVISAFMKRLQQGPIGGEWARQEEASESNDLEPFRPAQTPVLVSQRDVATGEVTFRPFTSSDAWEDLHDAADEPAISPPGRTPRASIQADRERSRTNIAQLLEHQESLRQGIVLAEILGPPRSLRRSHRLEGRHLR